MGRFRFNWGVMLALVVLLTFTYIAFLGMLYKFDGNAWKAGGLSVAIIAVVSLCVIILVNSKLTKNKEIGTVGQIAFGLVILSTFSLAGVPFSSFLKVIGNKNEINTEIEAVKTAAIQLDDAYNTYATERIAQYKKNNYSTPLKVQSLQRRLLPDSIATIQQQRNKWVANINEMSIWNINMPQNLSYIKESVNRWTDDYKSLSSIAYDNETLKPFEYQQFNTSLDDLINDIKHAKLSLWAVIVAILCALGMMVPYWLAQPPRINKEGDINWDL